MTFTLLRLYPTSSNLAMAFSMILSNTSCVYVASCSCHLIKGEEARVGELGVEKWLEQCGSMKSRLSLDLGSTEETPLDFAPRYSRVLIKEGESRRAASWLSLPVVVRGEPELTSCHRRSCQQILFP
jgi:hypothetical protein